MSVSSGATSSKLPGASPKGADSSAASGGSTDATRTSRAASRAAFRVPALLALALFVLRFCAGYHFFSDGARKFSYNPDTRQLQVVFSAENFLRAAVGPFANFYHSQAPSFHNWQAALERPRSEIQSGESAARDPAGDDDETVASEAPAHQTCLDVVRTALEEQFANFSKLQGLGAERTEKGRTALKSRIEQLADYLQGEEGAIAEFQHELWRLQTWETGKEAADLPFSVERVAEKKLELKGKASAWVKELRGIERGFRDDLKSMVTDDEKKLGSDLEQLIIKAVSDPREQQLKTKDAILAYGIVAIGVCLMLGLFTRLAALAGAVFLVMVMASQPPWIAGAKADLFFYQLVEAAAMLTLCAAGAGRWAGLDFLLGALWKKCCASGPAS